MEYNQFMEALKGKQKKLDKNHNGELDSQDFAILRGQNKANEEVEQIDELSKNTLGSYVKKATRDARLKHGMGKDFERISKSSRKPEYKAGAKEWEDKYKSDSRKREAGIGKAVDRLTKEEVEQVDEIHRMKTKLNKLDPISNRSVARQKLTNLMKSGKARGALIANKMRTLNMGDDIDQEDLDALHEVLSKDAKASDWIHDFVHSTNPKFEGKSKKERIKMALGAYYGKQRNEEFTDEELDETYFGPRADKLIAHSHAAFRAGDKETSSRAHKIAMKAAEKWHKNPENKEKAISHIMSGVAKDYADQEKKRGIGHVRDHVELEGDVIEEGKMKQLHPDSEMKDIAPVAPVPDKKYIKGTPEYKAHKEKMKSRTGHPTNEETVQEDKMTTTKDKSGKMISFKYEGDWKKATEKKEGSGKAANLAGQAMQKMRQANESKEDPAEYDQEGDMAKTQLRSIKYHADELHEMLGDNDNLPEWVQSKLTLAQDYLQTVCDYMYSKNEVNEAAYAGLEKEDKPGKIKTAVVKLHPKGVESETVEGWKDTKKPVKESFDDEGNLIPHKISYKDFITEIKMADLPVRRIQGRSYGANYEDPEGADDYDERKPTKPATEKRGRGRPVGAKSGARKITGTSKLMNK